MWLPHNTEVGAGTMNPATFLRVLGPEPWNVAYAEPSVRPDDSRYGENPNRVQRHTQFQVILKPDPGNPLELYLGSLAALGIDAQQHDVRFVEDNWESPALGAWGLGWEVWLDGMEITQFTYFQQAGGQPLDCVAVEITYGLERIVMALQGVDHFKDIQYNDKVKYGEMFLQNEYEMSVYNLDKADISDQRRRFELFQSEAKRMIEERLPIPAYDHLLKISHTFNVLDARGAVGVTERANNFRVMRTLSRDVSRLWLERREEIGHPLGIAEIPGDPEVAPSTEALPAAATFVLEIGTEELPPDEVDNAAAQLRDRFPAILDDLRLAHGGVSVRATPRRLVVSVSDLAPRQEDLEDRRRGPPADKALDEDGNLTKAGEGFCRKNGVTKEQIEVDGKYVFATVREEGRAAGEVLGPALAQLVTSLNFRKSMRWGAGATAFSRPVRWLVAMHGAQVVPFAAFGLASGSTTRVLRNDSKGTEREVASAEEYDAVIESAGIMVCGDDRREQIWADACRLADEVGGVIPESAKTDLLDEVANLVEAPNALRGSFNEEYLQLPPEVLVMVMRKHQRYFPVYDKDGKLLNHFITVANGPIDTAAVRVGNEAVLTARFSDAVFFYKEDLEVPLADFVPKLEGTMFQKELGTLLDKNGRVEGLVAPVADILGVPDCVDTARSAAELSKADLATAMVMEMTSLAGTMGRHYAEKQGLPAPVCEAIFEAVLPRSAGDKLPTSPAGIVVSVCDKLDSLVGLFAAGCAPTASADPYGLRRAAYGMLQPLVSSNVRCSLAALIDAAAAVQPLEITAEHKADVVDFVQRRLEQLFVDDGLTVEAVRAVLAERGDDPALAKETAADLAGLMGSDLLKSTMQVYARPVRLTRGKDVDPAWVVQEDLFEQDEERALYATFKEVQGKVDSGMKIADFLEASQPLAEPMEAFFDNVFVMAEDEQVRKNRLAFLRDLAQLPDGIVSFSELPGF
ncbi:unnamed protein product [Pedinophyceae sp. YPF-701]|nr:unnamed protein product [Pedinophyceae sp. YPF-701]